MAKIDPVLQSDRNSTTLEAPGGKTVRPRELINDIKVVQNVISDNFFLDLNIVRPKLSALIFYFILKQW